MLRVEDRKREAFGVHPYQELESRSFWATGVAQTGLDAIADLWRPKFRIEKSDAVVTFGSCFAQHFGRALAQWGHQWLITEQAPKPLSAESRKTYNYDVFSARTGNIYTTSLLKQWTSWALRDRPIDDEVWVFGDRYFDPFRPVVEPTGFASAEEVVVSRRYTVGAFGEAIAKADVLVFTMGLTECWVNSATGVEYPMCPGTAAGAFDASRHHFVNREYPAVREALADVIARLKAINPKLRILLTVSPVPLTATMSGNHVLLANTESKSVLRAVAGSLTRDDPHIDYFPSYEIASSPMFRGMFYDANLRSVSAAGVGRVMRCFSDSMDIMIGNEPQRIESSLKASQTTGDETFEENVVCEEALLDAFAPKS